MNTIDPENRLSAALHNAIRVGVARFLDHFPPGTIPAEVEELLVMATPDKGDYVIISIYLPAPKNQEGFSLFEAWVDKRTSACDVKKCRTIADIPPERLVSTPNDPV